MGNHISRTRAPLRKITFLAVAAGLGIAATATAAGSSNPANGHTYEVVSGGMSWHAANTAAQSMTNGGSLCVGHLATITSQAESDFLVATFGGALLNLKWLGGFQDSAGAEPRGGWGWVTGEAWSYENWGGFEPNNNGGAEDALVLFFGNGTWNDAPENFNYGANGGYVVEYDCLQVAIDIKPGSFPNSINNNGNGVIPVAILTTADFDASTVDPATVTLDGATVRAKGKSGKSGSLEDVDGDGDLDLVVHIQDVAGTWATGDSMATLSAMTYSGQNIVGTDSIRLVPPES